jgi:hypothetical protein
LKNSNFFVDHNSEDRWQLRWKTPWGFGGLAGFAACDSPIWLAVTTTSLDDAMRVGARFSQLLSLRVFQQYRRIAALQASPREGRESFTKRTLIFALGGRLERPAFGSTRILRS